MAEISLFKIRRGKLEEMAEGGNEKAGAMLSVLDRKASFASAVQIGITAASILLGWYGGPVLAHGLAFLCGGKAFPGGWPLELFCALLIIVILHVSLAELVPRLFVVGRTEEVFLSMGLTLRFTWRGAWSGCPASILPRWKISPAVRKNCGASSTPARSTANWTRWKAP